MSSGVLPSPDAVATRVRKASSLRPVLAIALGSGFAGVEQTVSIDASISFARLPGFPRPGVSGHAGRLIVGRLGELPVVVLSGRAHYYEGYSMPEVTFPVRVLAACGIKHLLLTNAAGAINATFRPGHLMVIRDHINLLPHNPLHGIQSHSRFVDLTRTYDSKMSNLLKKAGRHVGVSLKFGVYLAVPGPSYETPAEIRAFARLGADAVGMSTVPEAIVARHCGIAVAGLSCISNMAAGLGQKPVSHAEVLATGQRVTSITTRVITRFAELFAAR